MGYGNRQGISVDIDNVGVQYRIMRWMGVGGEITTYIYQGPLNNTAGFGARPFARWYIVHKNNWDLFFEYGAGIIWNLQNFPVTNDAGPGRRLAPSSTSCPKYSLGAEFKLQEQMFVTVGIRHVHVSNGYIFGPDRQPGFRFRWFFYCRALRPQTSAVDPLFDNSRIAVKIKHHKKLKPVREL